MMTTDDKVIRSLDTVISMAEGLSLQYLIFGSCGIQSYFKFFFRLPNDIDFVLRANEIKFFLEACHKKNYEIIEEQGRYKIYIDNFPIHIIPEVFSVINKEDATIIAKVDFSTAFDESPINRFKLLLARNETQGNIMPLDYTIFMELVRKQDTNSLQSLCAILNLPSLPIEKVSILITKYPALLSRINTTLGILAEKILSLNAIYPNPSTIIDNFKELSRKIKTIQ